MINIAVIDDECEEIERLTSYFDKFSEGSGIAFNVKSFTNPVNFLTGYSGNYDIVFMDIELPDMDGMTAARKLRASDSDVTIIFVTNMAQFAVKGYEVDAFDFIVKPISYLSFNLKLKRALEYRRSRNDTKIMIKISDGFECVMASELAYVEILNHTLIYHTTRGHFTSYDQLKKIEAPLLEHNFVRCSRCYLVNLRYVTSVKGFDIVVGGDELQVSHQKRREFLRALADYLGGGVS